MAAGRSNKEISSALNIATDTTKIHVKNIFLKLDVRDRTQAVVTADKRGIIHLHRAP
jgi:ATP/maltotriose-dependent transcriptional regulator MalT